MNLKGDDTMQDNNNNVVGLTNKVDEVEDYKSSVQREARAGFMSKNDLKNYLRNEAIDKKQKLQAQKWVNREFDKLQTFIIEEFPNEITKDGPKGAVQVAIELLTDYKNYNIGLGKAKPREFDKQKILERIEKINNSYAMPSPEEIIDMVLEELRG